MTRSYFAPMFVALSITLTVALFADPVSGEDKINFTYKDADLYKVAADIGKRMNKNFVIDPVVKGKITILPAGPLTVEAAYEAFLIGLAMNGLTVFEQGPFSRIEGAQTAQRSNIEIVTELPNDNRERVLTYIYPAKHVLAKELYNSLGPIMPSRLGEMRVFDERNILIITDYLSNLKRVQKVLEGVDLAKK